jgi:Skp family chaperone for outer membrane proteins
MPPAPLSVATLNQDALFLQSAFGQRLQHELEAERDAIAAENRKIEAELVAEEKTLTEQRKTLSPAEFSPRAQAFDDKVEALRKEQDAKARALQQKLDRERQRFLKVVGPVLADLLRSRGAQVLLDSNAVLIAVEGVDITPAAIAAIDARIGDGSDLDPGDTSDDAAPSAPDDADGQGPDPQAGTAGELGPDLGTMWGDSAPGLPAPQERARLSVAGPVAKPWQHRRERGRA